MPGDPSVVDLKIKLRDGSLSFEEMKSLLRQSYVYARAVRDHDLQLKNDDFLLKNDDFITK